MKYIAQTTVIECAFLWFRPWSVQLKTSPADGLKQNLLMQFQRYKVQCCHLKRPENLSVGHARGREVKLDPLNMTSIDSDRQLPSQTSRSY
jgi:hypothetical protein